MMRRTVERVATVAAISAEFAAVLSGDLLAMVVTTILLIVWTAYMVGE